MPLTKKGVKTMKAMKKSSGKKKDEFASRNKGMGTHKKYFSA